MDLVTTHKVRREHLGSHDNLFGGQLLAWVDIAGYIFVADYYNEQGFVTKALRGVWHKPVPNASIVKIYASLKRKGNTSVTIDLVIKVNETSVWTGEMTLVRADNWIKKTI